MQRLYVCKELVTPFFVALRNLTRDMAMEVLPVLRNLFLEGPCPSISSQETIEQFLSFRQDSAHPISLDPWKQDQ